MAIKIWRGDEQVTRHRVVVTVDNPEAGDEYTLTINRKALTVVADADGLLADAGTDTEANLIDDVLTRLAAAVGAYNNTIPEWAECTASVQVSDTTGLGTSLWIYGPLDGAPITITGSSSDAGSQSVTISTVQAGSAGTNEIQRISFPGTPTGGTFTLTFEGQTTGTIAYNASAATVETALEGLSNIASGDVSVSGDAGGPYTVEFLQAYAATDVALLSSDGSSLTGGGTVNVVTTTQGGSGANEIWSFSWDNVGKDLSDADYVNFISAKFYDRFATGNQTSTVNLTVSDSASTIKNRIETAFTAATGQTVTVTKTSDDPEDDPSGILGATVTVEWSGGINAGENLADTGPVPIEITKVENNDGDDHADESEVTVAKIQDGGSPDDEVQVITLQSRPTGGTFTLTFEGQTTGAIAYNASAATVETNLEALSNITGVTVTGDAGGPWTVTFDASPQAGNDVGQMTGSGASLTGMTLTHETTQAAVASTNEIQRVTLSSNTTGGTFTLTWDPGGGDETTGNIAYNATADAVETALEGLTTPGAGDFEVTGDAGGPWDVEFIGSTYGATDVNEMEADGANLTGIGSQSISVTDDGTGDSVSPTGPNWISHAANWQDTSTSTASAPANGDVLVFENNAVDALYGLDELSAVTLLELHIRASYTGRLGLPTHTGDYFEYRPTAFEIGATDVWVGEGDGAGSPLIRLDFGSVEAAIDVWNTGTPEDDQPALQFQGTNTSNVLRVYRGSVGVGTEQWEDAAALASMVVSYVDSQESDAMVYVGPNVTTLSTVDQTGGTVTVDGDSSLTVTTWTMEAGAVVFGGEAAITTFRARTGELVYNSSGTVTTMDVGPGGVVRMEQDQRGRTFTNCTMVAGAALLDPGGTVTFTNGIDLDNCGLSEVTLDVGRNLTLTPSAI